MKRIASAALLAAALACGSGDTVEQKSVDAAPPAGSRSGTPATGVSVAGDVEAKDDAALHPSVPRCLDLVREGKLVEAVQPCTEALENVPDDHDVASALEQAKAAAQEQATAAAQQAATDAASGAAGDAASGLQQGSPSPPTELP